VVGERAQALDLDGDDVARFYGSREGGRARQDDVARYQRDESSDVRDEVVHVPGHLVGGAVLSDDAVDARAHGLAPKVPRRYDTRPQGAERVGAFHAQHRAGVGVSKVVQTEVVGDGVARDVVLRRLRV
jgi:hypothetical protein